MARSDTGLHEMLLRDLAETGDAQYDPGEGVISLRGFMHQRPPVLRLHLTPEQLGRAVRHLAPDYGEAFPLLDAEDSTVLVLWLDILVAVQHADPHTLDLILWPYDATARETRAPRSPRRSGR